MDMWVGTRSASGAALSNEQYVCFRAAIIPGVH